MQFFRVALAAILALAACAAHAFDPFVVKDIRIEGIQRTEAGTVFSYLPVKVGDTLTDDKTTAAIKALFATGFFKDVRIEAQDGVLIVTVEERPSISKITLSKPCPFSRVHGHLQGDKGRRPISNHGVKYQIGCYKWRLLVEQCALKHQKA